MSYPFGFGARRARARTQALIAGLGKAPPDWSVTGDTNRTYFDRNGVLQTAAANEARVTYDPVTLLKRGVLVWSINQMRANIGGYDWNFAAECFKDRHRIGFIV